MKKLLKLAGIVLVAASLAACAAKKPEVSEPRTLVISTWGLSEDVMQKDVYGPFEELCNCTVILETGTTSERYTKLASDPNSVVDVIELSQSAAANGYAAGLFEKIDTKQVPNLDRLIDGALKTVELGYGPGFVLNSIGIIYDQAAVGFEITEWADLWRPELKGKISIPDIPTTFGPAMVHVAAEVAGKDVKSDNGAAAFEKLAELKTNVVKTYAKSSDLANMFAAGEIAAAVVGDFAIPTISKAAPNVAFVVPASGTYANFNTVDINKNSKNKDLAYMYINWRISAELQQVTAATLNEAPTNKDVVLTEEQAKNKTYGDVATRAKAIDYSFVNPILPSWVDSWNRTLNN